MAIKPSCLIGAKASVNAMFGVKVLSSIKIPLAVQLSPNEQSRQMTVTLVLKPMGR